MKLSKYLIAIIILVTVSVSIWNKIQLEKCKDLVISGNAKITEMREAHETLNKAFINSQTIAMRHLGKMISWLHLKQIFPEKEIAEDFSRNPKLVLIFSEFSCNVCQDHETEFAVEIAEEFGKKYVLAVVKASNSRYIRTYIRLNKVNFPVYHCLDEVFLESNDIKSTPLILLIDEEDRIIASHLPIPGHPDYSKPIHKFVQNHLYDYIRR